MDMHGGGRVAGVRVGKIGQRAPGAPFQEIAVLTERSDARRGLVKCVVCHAELIAADKIGRGGWGRGLHWSALIAAVGKDIDSRSPRRLEGGVVQVVDKGGRAVNI